MRSDLSFPAVAFRAMEDVLSTQIDAIWSAADLIVDAFAHDGILQVYGTGHSRIVTLEFASRAGGLAPVGMLAVKDLVMFGGVDPGKILDPTYEREPGIAAQLYDMARPRPADVFLIVSNSGINNAVVEMADLVTRRGHGLIAITSLRHTAVVPSRASTSRTLKDYADIVIDNGAPAGDASVEIAPAVRIGALSSITGVYISQLVTEAVCRLMLANGTPLPVFRSANLVDGDERNADLWAAYRERIRPIEP